MDAIKRLLDELGLSGLWTNQKHIPFSLQVFKNKVSRRLKDQYLQYWYTEIAGKDICVNYRMYKSSFKFEDYICLLPPKSRRTLMRFRTTNNSLPVQKERFFNVPRSERVCTFCDREEVGDEFHYLFICDALYEQRKKILPVSFWKRPNAVKFGKLLGSNSKSLLVKVVSFINLINVLIKST